MTNEQKKQAEAEFAQRAANVTGEDVEVVLRNRGKADNCMQMGFLTMRDLTMRELLSAYWGRPGVLDENPFMHSPIFLVWGMINIACRSARNHIKRLTQKRP